MEAAPGIDWSPAAVARATLTAELTGEPSPPGAEHIDGVIAVAGGR